MGNKRGERGQKMVTEPRAAARTSSEKQSTDGPGQGRCRVVRVHGLCVFTLLHALSGCVILSFLRSTEGS